MSRFPIRAPLEKGAAADLWRRTLSQIPTVFGRMVYLCSLRDQNTGRYEHFGLIQNFGEDEADRVLRESHERSFGDWLCLALEQQKADLDFYLSGLNGDRASIVATWIRLAPYRNLAPSSARQIERDLYVSDLEVILGLLKAEYGVACPDPDA